MAKRKRRRQGKQRHGPRAAPAGPAAPNDRAQVGEAVASSPPPARWPGRRERWFLAAVVLAALAVYANTLGHDAVYDGRQVLETFPAIRNPFDLRAVFTTPYDVRDLTAPEVRNTGGAYRPLTIWSFAWVYRVNQKLGLKGVHPAGQHLVNVLLFAAVSGLVFAYARRVLRAPPAVALFAALLFAVHPIHAEVAAGIVGRSELLAAGLGILFLWTHAAGARPWACAPLYLAALLSKESAAGFLAVAVAHDLLFGDAGTWRARLGAYALYAAVFLGWWFGLRANVVGHFSPGGSLVDNPLRVLPLDERLLTAFSVQLDYLLLQVAPASLSADYSYAQVLPVDNVFHVRFLGFLAAFAGAVTLAWRVRRTHPRVTLSVLGYAALFAPTSNLLIVIGTVMGERLAFAPSLFFCLLAGEGLGAVFARRPRSARVLAAVVCCAFAARTVARNHVWADEPTFLRAMREDAPRSVRAHMACGRLFLAEGDAAGALACFQTAQGLLPNRGDYWQGKALEALDRPDEALEAYRRALAAGSPYPAHRRLFELLMAAGRKEEARALVQDFARRAPDHPDLPVLRARLGE